MKKIFMLVAMAGLVGVGLLAGCKKEEAPAAPEMPSTNAPAMPSTNAP